MYTDKDGKKTTTDVKAAADSTIKKLPGVTAGKDTTNTLKNLPGVKGKADTASKTPLLKPGGNVKKDSVPAVKLPPLSPAKKDTVKKL